VLRPDAAGEAAEEALAAEPGDGHRREVLEDAFVTEVLLLSGGGGARHAGNHRGLAGAGVDGHEGHGRGAGGDAEDAEGMRGEAQRRRPGVEDAQMVDVLVRDEARGQAAEDAAPEGGQRALAPRCRPAGGHGHRPAHEDAARALVDVQRGVVGIELERVEGVVGPDAILVDHRRRGLLEHLGGLRILEAAQAQRLLALDALAQPRQLAHRGRGAARVGPGHRWRGARRIAVPRWRRRGHARRARSVRHADVVPARGRQHDALAPRLEGAAHVLEEDLAGVLEVARLLGRAGGAHPQELGRAPLAAHRHHRAPRTEIDSHPVPGDVELRIALLDGQR
jgi:hypothetical protein